MTQNDTDTIMMQKYKLIWLLYSSSNLTTRGQETRRGEQSVERLAMIKLSSVASGLAVVRNNKDLWLQPRTTGVLEQWSTTHYSVIATSSHLGLFLVPLNISERGKTDCKLVETGWTSIIEIIELHKIIGNDFCNNQSNLQSLFCWFDQSKAASFSEL